MMKKKYKRAEMEVITFLTEDVLTTSGYNDDDYEGWNPNNPGGSGGEDYEGWMPH